jgi:energy-coupling factor transport system permease protein
MLSIHEKDTFLKRLYPMTKIWGSLGFIIGVFTFSNYYISTIIFVLALFMILRDKMLKEFKILLVAALLLGLSLFLIQGILSPSNQTVVWNIIPGTGITLYKEGLTTAADVYCRIVPLIAVLFLAIRTLNITELGVALNKAGVSYRASFVLTSTFQIIPVLNKEMHQVMNAQKSRGLDTEGSLLNRMKAFIPIMVPLISNSIMKVQNQVVALESKGFNSSMKKTFYRDPPKSKADTLIVMITTLFALSGVAYRLYVVFMS